jgi:ribosomal protein S18 acetylase RimI-like enzyme
MEGNKEQKQREIRIADIKDVPELLKITMDEGWRSFTEELFIKFIEEKIIFVSEIEGEIVGYLRFITDGVLTTYIPGLLVKKKYRGQGIGQELLEEIQISHSGTRVECLSEVDNFYKKIGFRNMVYCKMKRNN